MALNLGDAKAWVDRAMEQNDELEAVYRAWVESASISLIGQRHPQFVRWEWDVAIVREPSTNLSILAGEIFDALRRALDYVAWQVYVTGSAARSEKQDRGIYFPIVTDAATWEQQFQNKVPGASDACAEALEASQPFAQDDVYRAALPTLAAFINRDKHRRLSQFATGAFSLTARGPQQPSEELAMIMAMARPVPTFNVAESLRAVREAMGDTPAGVSWLVAFAELRRNMDRDSEVGQQVGMGDPVPWTDGIQIDDPQPPELQTGFATEDGDLIAIQGLRPLTEHTAEIVGRFANIE